MKAPIQILLRTRKRWLSKVWIGCVAGQIMAELIRRRLWPRGAGVGIVLVGESQMQRLNTRFLKVKRPTDVLSFPGDICCGDGGEIVLCPVYLARQARRFGQPFEVEVARMMVHGFLHLAGFDHATRAQEKKLFGLQEGILVRLPLIRKRNSVKNFSRLEDFIKERTHG